MTDAYIISADIGGSHITAAIYDLDKNMILPDTLTRSLVNAHQEAGEIIRVWSGVLQKVRAMYQLPQARIGIALPGPFDYESGICGIQNQNKYESMYGLNVKDLLAQSLKMPKQNLRLINDAGSFLQGEVLTGNARGYSHVIGVTLGTGLGTSRFHKTKAEDANLWCLPFLDSIAEDYLSTRWFIARYHELSGVQVPGVKELVALADHDKRAKLVFEEFGTNLGNFLVQFIQLDAPELIIMGGNIAHASNLFLAKVNQVLSAHHKQVPILKSTLGENANLIGAACCWHEMLVSAGIN